MPKFSYYEDDNDEIILITKNSKKEKNPVKKIKKHKNSSKWN